MTRRSRRPISARAIALCHLDGSFDAFSDYLAHPEIIERRARSGG